MVTDWSQVNFEGRRNGEIAQELGCTPTAVSMQRKRWAPHTAFRPGRATVYDWAAANWSDSDEAIAARLGCSLVRVREVRRKNLRESEKS